MTLFVDNDVIKKLAALDLLDPAIEALGFKVEESFVLDTAKYKFLADKSEKFEKGKKKYGARTHPRIVEFLGRAQSIVDQFDQDLHDALASVENIDDGEAVLLSATASNDGALLTTGDKRCIAALASAEGCQGTAKKLEGRIICVEQVILRVISHTGFDKVLEKAIPGLPELQDNALRVAFGSGAQTKRENAEEALTRYVAELRVTAAGLLVP